MQNLLLLLFYITSFYAFIPSLISRLFGFRVFRRGRNLKDFALTFDDGPDPDYTPQLLDLLKRHGAKATFFVVGEHAERNPELLKRMHDEGHLIGIHNYVHKTNWLMTPNVVRQQIEKTDAIIYHITGSHALYYRPPWGITNLFDFSKKHYHRIVLWSGMFGDWRERVGADRLTERMLKKLRGGEVMVLHDCGTTPGADKHAPAQMLIALDRVLTEANRRNIQSIRIDDMIALHNAAKQHTIGREAAMKIQSGLKQVVVRAWLIWEQLFHMAAKLKTITPQDPFLHYRVRPYQGKAIKLTNGNTLQKGDDIIELHFDNKKLYQLGTSSKTTVHLAIRMIRLMEKQLPDLVKIAVGDPKVANAKALYGVSMINRGPEQFGFSVLDLPRDLFAASTSIYLKILLSVIHPAGQNRLREGSQQMVPKMIVMPMELLYERFGDGMKPKEQAYDRSSTKTAYVDEEDTSLTGTTDLTRTPPVA
ncbi:polysaccharide deacetylase family protein [Neobacillus mesonae]|nr:polysaccharide deacetylase family protein [Neobacillus mesonae]